MEKRYSLAALEISELINISILIYRWKRELYGKDEKKQVDAAICLLGKTSKKYGEIFEDIKEDLVIDIKKLRKKSLEVLTDKNPYLLKLVSRKNDPH